jgi:nucleoside-triphosphatase THEP1
VPQKARPKTRNGTSPKLFCDVVQQALDSPAIVLATIMERPHPFADQIKRRPDVVIFDPTVENRNQLPATITAMIREELQQNR